MAYQRAWLVVHGEAERLFVAAARAVHDRTAVAAVGHIDLLLQYLRTTHRRTPDVTRGQKHGV